MKSTLPSAVLLAFLCSSASFAKTLFQSFEGDGFDDWELTGTAFGLSPVHGELDEMNAPFTGYASDAFATSAHGGNPATGTLTSPEFQIKDTYITFLIAGGSHSGKTAAQLLVNGEVVRESVANNSLHFEKAQWNVEDYKGDTARIRLIDDSDDDWGFIAADYFLFTNYANEKMPSPTKNGKLFIDGLISTNALPGAVIPANSTLEIQASFDSHNVVSPTAITFNEKGDIYIAETHRFRHGVEDDRDNLYWYLDDLAAMTTADRAALHEKWKEKVSIDYLTEKSEMIRKLSDTDGDGQIDKQSVFAEGFNDVLDGTAAGIYHHEGAVYFACIPNLYKLTDSDQDGVADAREIIQDGFGVRISLSGHDLNGFALGPDGRIYGTIGDRGFSGTTKSGKEYDYRNEGALFRFEPDGSNFELVHTGLRNPKEIAFDEDGNAFTVDNNSDQGDGSRIVYLVEGGDSGWQMEHQAMHTFHRQIGLDERPPSRWMDERMWELQNEVQPAYILPPTAHLSAGPSGLTYYPGSGFLNDEAGRFLICDYKGGSANSGIWSFAMEPEGATMKLADSRHFAWGIAATDVEYSLDGRVYITDFVTGWKSHDAGRVLSIKADEPAPLTEGFQPADVIFKAGVASLESEELVMLLNHPDQRVRLHAQINLTRRENAVEAFQKGLQSDSYQSRLHSTWGLGILARRGAAIAPDGKFQGVNTDLRKSASEQLVKLLADEDQKIRTQALMVLSEAEIDGDALPLSQLITEQPPRVQFAAGIAIGKLRAATHLPAVLEMLAKNNNRDIYLRHAGIYALQHAATSPSELVELHEHPSQAVRLAAVVALRRLNDGNVAEFLGDKDISVRDEAIRAIYDKGLESERPKVAALLDEINVEQYSEFMLRRVIHATYREGGLINAQRLLKVVSDPKFPDGARKESLRLLENWAEPFPVDQLTGHWAPLEKRDVAIIKPALMDSLPSLLKEKGFILTGILKLIKAFDIDIANLGDDALRSLVVNENLLADARSEALSLYIQLNPTGLSEFLSEVSTDTNDEIAGTALLGLANLDPDLAYTALKTAISSGKPRREQQAWDILASLQADGVVDLFISSIEKLIQLDGKSASGIELLEAAKQRDEALIKSALSTYDEFIAASSDPLTPYHVSLQGGDITRGASLFSSHPAGQCMRCHKADDAAHSAGGDAGPNLAGIAKQKDARYLLESMIDPGAAMAPGYGITSVTFTNGKSIAGNLITETKDHIDIGMPDKTIRIKKADIKTSTPPVSPMPPMGVMLSKTELRDLVAWLESLDKSETMVEVPAPELFDPSTLLDAE